VGAFTPAQQSELRRPVGGIDCAKVNAGAGRPAGYENQRPHGRPGMTDADREGAAGRGDNHSVHFS
jgi:hypothetical protein